MDNEFTQIRKELKLSQQAIANKLGKSLRQIQYYEASNNTRKVAVPKTVKLLLDQLKQQNT